MGQTAEELLDSLTDEQIEAYTADPASEEHIVVGADRFIVVPSALKRIAVQFDHNIETVTFDCPRYWDGHDMSKMAIYINYMRADNARGSYAATDITVDETDENIMHFNWTISGNVTEVKGTISFLICVKKADGEGNMVNHWNSELNREMSVSEGLECGESIFEEYPDLITQLLLKMDELGKLLVISDDGNGNVNIEGLNTTLNIADTFSDKATYAAGDYVMFYGSLFKCIEPVTAYGMWTAANWKEVNITDEVKECFQYVSDGKAVIASAIIDMGVQTGATDTFEQMATNIRSIKTGVAAGGTAEVGDVTLGKTFINNTGQLLTGTSTAAADLVDLQGRYDILVSDKSTLQGQYDAVVAEKNAIQASYDEYKNAVVTGLANSGLGVTANTTASELQAILSAQYPAWTPYEVDINTAFANVTVSDCTVNSWGTDPKVGFGNGGWYMSINRKAEAEGTQNVGTMTYRRSFETKGCNKVDILCSGWSATINGEEINGTVLEQEKHTFNCTGSTFDIELVVTTTGGERNAAICHIIFYHE